MPFEPLTPPPLLTADLPGIGGRIKAAPEDFEVEEIPAYQPSGEGDYLYLWIEKRGMGAEYFRRQLAQRLGIPAGEIGTAGMKDRHAVTRQMVSVPAAVEANLNQVEGDGIRLLRVSRHGNKLRPGHLHGNRFRILVREVVPEAGTLLEPLLARIRSEGLPNFYGPQRFGHDGETVLLGLGLLRGDERPTLPSGQRPNLRNPFLRKLSLSAAQSALFNHYLARRLSEGLLRRVLPGDVMAKWPFGGMFTAEDPEREQARCDAREIVPAGPMFGKKMHPATRGVAAEREEQVLKDAELTRAAFQGFGKLLSGTRRYCVIYIDDLDAQVESEGVRLSFTLPAGSYATVLLRELTRGSTVEGEEESGEE